MNQKSLAKCLVALALTAVVASFALPTSRRPAQAQAVAVPEPWTIVRTRLAQRESAVLFAPPQLSGRPELAPLSAEAHAILREVFAAATAHDAALQQSNLEIVDRLQGYLWPRVAGLKWIHLTSAASNPPKTRAGWLLSEKDGVVVWLSDDFHVALSWPASKAGDADGYREIATASFQSDLREFLGDLPRRAKARIDWDWDAAHAIEGGAFEHRLLLLACAAAQHGLRDEARDLARAIVVALPSGLDGARNGVVWHELSRALSDSAAPEWRSSALTHSDREAVLRTCRDLRTAFPANQYSQAIDWLVEQWAPAPTKPRPAYLARPRSELNEEELIRLLIHDLQSPTGDLLTAFPAFWKFFVLSDFSPQLFSDDSPAQDLVQLGPSVLPYLVEAVDDETPCRPKDYDRHRPDEHKLLTRQQIVLACLERITGCDFVYDGTLEGLTPAQRASVVAHVRRWWELAQGRSQADMVRIYLETISQNSTLGSGDWFRRDPIVLLAKLEGPEAVLEELRGLPAGWHDEPTYLERFAPSRPAPWAFAYLREGKSLFSPLRANEISELLKYGDSSTYRDLAAVSIGNELFTSSTEPQTQPKAEAPKHSPAVWFNADHVRLAARHGQNWAIPLLLAMLRNTEETQTVAGRRVSVADLAMGELIRLTGRDFGYAVHAPHDQRVATFEAARDWAAGPAWNDLSDLIAREHPPVRPNCDLFLTEGQIAETVSAIGGDSAASRRAAIAGLGDVYSWQVQRALLGAMEKESDAKTRLRVLELLQTSRMLWHLPALTRVLQSDPDVTCRVTAAQMLAGQLAEHDRGEVDPRWIRLETREAALQTARAVAFDGGAPIPVRRAALEMLLAWRSEFDMPLLQRLNHDPVFQHRPLMAYFPDVLDERRIGQGVMPDLNRLHQNDDIGDFINAIEALDFLEGEAAPALPALLDVLDREDGGWLSEKIVDAIVSSRAPAMHMLSERVQAAQRPHDKRDLLVAAMARLDLRASAVSVVPYLAETIRANDSLRRLWAARLLAVYGPLARSALPALQVQSQVDRGQVRSAILSAIDAIESPGK